MFNEDGVVVEELFEVVLLLFDLKGVRQQRVPVIECVEFSCNAVLVLELLVEKQLRVELEFEVVATQVLHVVFDHNLDSLSCGTTQKGFIFPYYQMGGMLPGMHSFSLFTRRSQNIAKVRSC